MSLSYRAKMVTELMLDNRRRGGIACLLCAMLGSAPVLADTSSFTNYESRTEFLQSSAASRKGGLYGYINPATLTYLDGFESVFAWSGPADDSTDGNRWGLFSAVPHFGFGLIRHESGDDRFNEYRLSLASGNRNFSSGVSYGWSSGSSAEIRPGRVFALGALLRPSRYVSLGLGWTGPFSLAAGEAVIDAAARPLGTDRLTLFADYATRTVEVGGGSFWSAGGTVALLSGLQLTGRYLDDRTVGVGVEINVGRIGIITQRRHDRRRDRSHNVFALRLGEQYRSALTTFGQRPRYLDLNLYGPIKHRRSNLFDRSRTLLGLHQLIDRARRDSAIAGIVLNISGMQIDWEMAWELRETLRSFRDSGKRVVIHADRLDLRRFHFASVADSIVLDPAGFIALEGFVAGHTYVQGSLDKLGIGVEEWRFFKYKSAFESLTRRGMSDADREQTQALIDDFYELARGEITRDRGMSADEFDRLVDEITYFLPEEALAHGLVDSLGRWDGSDDAIAALARGGSLVSADSYVEPVEDRWGEPARIAVVYALGLVAMDQGLRARRLVKDIRAVTEDGTVKAVVLRVVSPGGDILASDLLGDAVQKCRSEKPVIVSQGSVAGSGGYWISMYGDPIVAAPNSVTGSIGVIGGWIYDRGLKEKLGTSTDHVQAGRHADLGFGMSLPLLGQLPDRNLDEEEMERMEEVIRTLYAGFIDRVASARMKEIEEIEEVAQGRVWTGRAALQHGLVDQLGGLDKAVEVAAERAGIPDGTPFRIVEYPRPQLFDDTMFIPRFALGWNRDAAQPDRPIMEYLQFRLDHNGEPLLLTPIDFLLNEGAGGY